MMSEKRDVRERIVNSPGIIFEDLASTCIHIEQPSM